MTEDDDITFGEDEEDENPEEDTMDTQSWAEKNFKAVKKRIDGLQKELRNNKPQENINVRKVDTDDGERVVVEYSVQRWYSPQYFKKMMQDDDNDYSPSNDDDVVV